MNKNWKEVRSQLQRLIEDAQMPDLEIIAQAGLNRTTYYRLFDPTRLNAPMRKNTIFAIAKVLGVKVKYLDSIPQFLPQREIAPEIKEFIKENEIRDSELSDERILMIEDYLGLKNPDRLPPDAWLSLKDSPDDFEDAGIVELFSDDNIKTYCISGHEQLLLSSISTKLKSSGTMNQWLSILFALRAIESK